MLRQSAPSQSARTLDPDAPATTLDCGETRDSYRAPHIIDRPSHTVTATEGKAAPNRRGQGGKGANRRAGEHLRRRLTVAECAKLQGFPPDHPFQGNKGARYRIVGNAVPPIMAQLLAEAVMCDDISEGPAGDLAVREMRRVVGVYQLAAGPYRDSADFETTLGIRLDESEIGRLRRENFELRARMHAIGLLAAKGEG